MSTSTLNDLGGLICDMTLADRIKEAMGTMSPADLARATKKTPGAVTQWLDGTTKSLKGETAAMLQAATGYSSSWLVTGKGPKLSQPAAIASEADVENSRQPNISDSGSKRQDRSIVSHEEDQTEGIRILQFDTGGSMGHGVVLRDQPGVIKSWTVSDTWLQQNVHRITAPQNLCIVTGFGPSMQPLYNPGDPLLVDRGVTRVDIDGIYFFRVGTEGFVKQLQRIPTAAGLVIRAKSYNTLYDPFEIVEGMDFEVFGRVVKAWKGEEF